MGVIMKTRVYKKVKIGKKLVGDGEPCFIVAEIGINHNGDMAITKKLVDIAHFAGCDAVKFQKRTVDVVYTPEELAKIRKTPLGFTNGDLKRGLEFGKREYEEIDRYCREKGILWSASPWDEESVHFLSKFDIPFYKVASASLTDDNLLKTIRSCGKPIILSTGMSTLAQIDHAVSVIGEHDLVLLHCTSTYPCQNKELNLRAIQTLKDLYSMPIGYSGHEVGLVSTAIAVSLGACFIERHITLDRAMWGSDQAASVEPQGMIQLAKWIREIPKMMGDGQKGVFESEVPVMQKLRRVG